MLVVTNADRVVFPEVGKTKGDVVAYYERIAERALVHLAERPLSMRRFPRGIAAPGFFQKNVPPHYPPSIARFEVPRSRAATRKHARAGDDPADVTVYPLLREAEHLAYVANQGAIELHVTAARAPALDRPDRIVVDLDPPEGAHALVTRAAHRTRELLGELGLDTVPVATGSKGFHVVSAIQPIVDAETLALTMQKCAALLEAAHPDELTTAFRIKERGGKVFVDWLRNRSGATVIAPYSLRARARATVATPLTWDELDATAPDAFTIADVDRLLARPDPLAERARSAQDPAPFIAAVDAAFVDEGLVLVPFDRFRS